MNVMKYRKQPDCAEACLNCPHECKQPDFRKIIEAEADSVTVQPLPDGKGEPVRMWTTGQASRVRKLAREQCCNYIQELRGCLLLNGSPCVLETSLHLCCNYFRDAVLPLDKQLEAEITRGNAGMKKCVSCGRVFLPGSNRAKYCGKCAKDALKQQQRNYDQNKRKKSEK